MKVEKQKVKEKNCENILNEVEKINHLDILPPELFFKME